MADQRATLKAQLMLQVEAELEKALAVADEVETLTIDRIEEVALGMGAWSMRAGRAGKNSRSVW